MISWKHINWFCYVRPHAFHAPALKKAAVNVKDYVLHQASDLHDS